VIAVDVIEWVQDVELAPGLKLDLGKVFDLRERLAERQG